MSLLRRKGLFESTKVLFLPIAAISPNPDQPRTCFSREGLEELAASIQELGVLQPLSVRRSKNGGYELISGERRLRASRMAGLTEVPCILVSVDSQGSSLLALVENLQRRDLNFVEEATALAKLIETYHLSQEEAARRIGKSQHQKEHIDDGVEGRGGELGQQLSQQHRQAGHAAHGEMVGKFEKVDPHRHQQGAQVHQQEFAQQFLAVGHPFHFLSRW